MGSLAVAGDGAAPAADDAAPAPEAQVDDQRVDDDAGGDGGGEVDRPLSRREEATRRVIAAELSKFQQTYDQRLTQQQQQAQQEISRIQQENARLYGQIEALQRRPAQAPAAGPPRKNPDDLEREALRALDERKDFAEYKRLEREAQDVRLEARLEAERAKWNEEAQRNRPPPPMDPFIATQLAKHDHVAMAGPRGEMMVGNKMQYLQLQGWAPGPALVAKAFELAEGELKGAAANNAAAQPRYDSASASALGGVPSGRQPAPGGDGGGGGAGAPRLTGHEENVRKTMRMTVAEFHLWKTDPEKAAKTQRPRR